MSDYDKKYPRNAVVLYLISTVLFMVTVYLLTDEVAWVFAVLGCSTALGSVFTAIWWDEKNLYRYRRTPDSYARDHD